MIIKKKLIFIPKNVPESNQASSDIIPATFVTLSGTNDFNVYQSADNAIIYGIAQINVNNFNETVINNGEPVGIWNNSQQALLRLAGPVSSGDKVRSNVNGYGVKSLGGYYGAIAMQSGQVGDLISVIVQIGIYIGDPPKFIPFGANYNDFLYNTREDVTN